MKLIADCSHAEPFDITRYVRMKSIVDSYPKVRMVALKPLKIENMKYVKWQLSFSGTYSSKFCPYHKKYLGHYQSVDGISFGLPPYCARIEDPKEMSETDKHNAYLMQGGISQLQYGISLRNVISGKRGVAKYRAMGFVPTTSMRGAASCTWDGDGSAVMIPRRWMNRMVIPTRLVADDLVSPYFTWRRPKNGDYALLSRNPVLREEPRWI